ncbi:MAG: 50S ribosomal protein L25/general stress protein Ctc [Rhodocyclales bacterium]|nr:50S ribosomal protein L25/general stress protein Ctc [Rhodocyclales bacterium]
MQSCWRKPSAASARKILFPRCRVPGVIYGAGKPAESFDVDHNEIYQCLRKEAFHASVVTAIVDGQKQDVLLRDVQLHAYKPLVLHVDFQRVDANTEIHTKVPLHFVNGDVCPGVKLQGGIVSHVITEIDVACLPKALPEFIEVDLKTLEMGHSMHVTDLKLPAGVRVVQHGAGNPVVAAVMSVKGSDASAGAAADEGATPAA